jgi:hypothetical protein
VYALCQQESLLFRHFGVGEAPHRFGADPRDSIPRNLHQGRQGDPERVFPINVF